MGQNPRGLENRQQLDFVRSVEAELQKKKDEGDDYPGCVKMLEAPAGCGKTFTSNTIFAYCNLPGNKFLVLNCAYSGVAAQLLPGGLTIHKRFRFNPNMGPKVPEYMFL